MKKLLFGLVATIMLSVTGNAQETEIFTLKKLSETESKPLKEWYLKNNPKAVFASETLNVKTNDNSLNFNLLEVNIGVNLPKEYVVKSYLIDAISTNNSYKEHIVYIQREISFEGKKIVEIIDATTSEITDFDLINLTEEEYNELSSSLGLNARRICFKSFRSCFKKLTTYDELGQAACEWFPCSTIAYGSCVIASGEGYLQDGSNFIGASNCSHIYRFSNNSYIKI